MEQASHLQRLKEGEKLQGIMIEWRQLLVSTLKLN